MLRCVLRDAIRGTLRDDYAVHYTIYICSTLHGALQLLHEFALIHFKMSANDLHSG